MQLYGAQADGLCGMGEKQHIVIQGHSGRHWSSSRPIIVSSIFPTWVCHNYRLKNFDRALLEKLSKNLYKN